MVAGGGVPVALSLGLSMLGFQASIGALNDLTDLPADRLVKSTKPLVVGSVGAGQARIVVIAGFVVGLGLAVASSPLVALVGAAGAATGYAYDLRLKSSAWGPVAFAVGIPLLPVFAWLGATGDLPIAFLALVPAAALGGLALAIANALADEADDRRSGVATAATRLGPRIAWRLHLIPLAGMILIAFLALAWLGGRGPGLALVGIGCVLLVPGALVARDPGGRRRPSGWEIEAVAISLLGAGWLWALGLGAR